MKRFFLHGALKAFFFCCFLSAAFLKSPLFASEKLSKAAQNKIDEFMTLRMTVSTLSDNDAILSALDSFDISGGTSFSEEEELILENFVLLERYNYLKDDSNNKELLRSSLKAQKEKCDAWLKANKKEVPNKWLCVTYADTISCYISFSVSDVIKYGLSIKDYYLKAYAQDENTSYVLTNLAQWYYWAPKLNGGSKKKAGDYFEKAVKAARTDAERYFADIFLSQYLFETGDKGRSATLLREAKSYCPESHYVALIEGANKDGLSFFAWSKKHSSMDGKPED